MPPWFWAFRCHLSSISTWKACSHIKLRKCGVLPGPQNAFYTTSWASFYDWYDNENWTGNYSLKPLNGVSLQSLLNRKLVKKWSDFETVSSQILASTGRVKRSDRPGSSDVFLAAFLGPSFSNACGQKWQAKVQKKLDARTFWGSFRDPSRDSSKIRYQTAKYGLTRLR